MSGSIIFRRETIGNRTVSVGLIPFMRSRKIFFKAQGLRPNTRYFPYFGGVDISDFTREETTFSTFADRTDDNSNIFQNTTAHPDGSSNLVSDATGEIIGSFIIPNNSTLKFRAPNQEFKLLDISGGEDNDAISKARTLFTARGIITTQQDIVRSTRIITRVIRIPFDPLAQSFFVDPIENPSGIFLSKVRLYFATKSSSVPVQVQIRAMENGVPVSGPMSTNAIKFLAPADVNIPSDLTDLDNIRSNGTDFIFDEPLYLTPGREFAIVVLAETTDYTLHVAKTYDFLVGSTEARVNKQPTLGSLFMSQNSFTWTPDQDRDMMFQIYRAEFATSGTTYFTNATDLRERLLEPSVLTTNASDEVHVFMDGHGFSKNDKVFVSGITDSDVDGGFSFASSLLGSRTITKVDHTGFTFDADSNASSTVLVGGNNMIVTRNVMYDEYVANVQTLQPSAGTTISASGKFVSGSSYAAVRNTSPAYAKDGSYGSIQLNEINTLESPQVILNDSNVGVHSISGASFDLKLDLATDDPKVSPVIDLQRASVYATENIVDRQDESATTNFNVPISFVDETDKDAGSHAAKHVTEVINLEEPAVGLNILFSANRPGAAGFKVYFKTGTADDNLNDLPYVEVAETTNNPADENRTTFRQYEYLAGGQVGNLDAFTQFQVKIVMTSTNSSRIPVVSDLRVIALAT
jgi:hypothetical protein